MQHLGESRGAYHILKIERLRAGLTQREMAFALGFSSANAYGLKEKGERRFSVEEAMEISKRLKMSVEELFYCEGEQNVMEG